MSDLSAAIGSILNDPQSMAQLQNVMKSLGMEPNAAPAAPNPQPAVPAAPAAEPLAGSLANADSLGMLMRIAPLLSAAGQEDDGARLLAALRPLLGEARRKRLDDAQRILKMLRLLPLLKQSGLMRNVL